MGSFPSCEIVALVKGHTMSKKGPKFTQISNLFVTSDNWPAKKSANKIIFGTQV